MTSHPLVEAQGLGRRFFRRAVLDDVSFTLPEGAICGLVGPNGAGKSTTLRILLRLLRPSKGSARVLGTDVSRLGPSELRQIGYVAADQDLPEWMTGAGLLRFLRPLYPTWDHAFCRRLIRRFDVPLTGPIRTLSRGERMRLALVAGIAYRPRLLFLDEPFNGLDAITRDDVAAGILEAAGDGGWSVLLASHDLEIVEHLTDRTVMLDRGRLLLDEDLDAVLARFRRLRFSVPEQVKLDDLPVTWMAPEQVGRVLEVIDSRFDQEKAAEWARLHGVHLRDVDTLSLRKVFIALAGSRRKHRRGSEQVA